MSKAQGDWLRFFVTACVAGFCTAVGIDDIVGGAPYFGPTLIGLGILNFLLAVCSALDSAVAMIKERT